jgi:hypothetical protein
MWVSAGQWLQQFRDLPEHYLPGLAPEVRDGEGKLSLQSGAMRNRPDRISAGRLRLNLIT